MRSPFSVRRPGEEARAVMLQRRVAALNAEVDRLRFRSSWWRRLLCLVLGHRPWRCGLGGQLPTGELVALVVCRRCGRRQAERGAVELAAGGSLGRAP